MDTSTLELPVIGRGAEAIRRARVRLVVESRPWAGRSFRFERGLIRIGTDPRNDLALPDKYVSARHAELEVGDQGFLLRDVGSTNGTWLGENRIHEALIAPGAVIGIGRSALRLETDGTSEVTLATPRVGDIAGESVAIRECLAQLERYAATDEIVLLEGETGVGKDLFARTLHNLSARRDGPFEVFDCGAASPSLIEAEIFGHARGAFTDAKEARPGAFERAHGGTLFIDEVGELPLELQPKLLRILEGRRVRRLGDGREIPVDVRVVSATNADLASMVARKTFRADLYYRLDVLRLEIPSLRHRKEDIPLIAGAILARQDPPGGPCTLDPAALAILSAYDWPGNVRELKNVLHRAALMARGSVGPADIALGKGEPVIAPGMVSARLPYREAKRRCVDGFERAYVQELLERHGGNVSSAAEAAGIPRQTLHRLKNKHRMV
jgi:transcriptional regulator with PAS, ATPase and Fis domain